MPNGFPLLLRSQLRTESASALLSAAVATLRQLPALDVRQRLARLCGQRPARLCGMQTAQSACHRLAAAPTAEVQMALIELELAARIHRHPGGRVSRAA